MNPLSVFCTVTGRPVDTGIETDWSTYFSLRTLSLRVRCPECSGYHEIRVGDGYLSRPAFRVDVETSHSAKHPWNSPG
jgi:hypothetical protein